LQPFIQGLFLGKSMELMEAVDLFMKEEFANSPDGASALFLLVVQGRKTQTAAAIELGFSTYKTRMLMKCIRREGWEEFPRLLKDMKIWYPSVEEVAQTYCRRDADPRFKNNILFWSFRHFCYRNSKFGEAEHMISSVRALTHQATKTFEADVKAGRISDFYSLNLSDGGMSVGIAMAGISLAAFPKTT
jgi:hypothetical protein